MDSLSFLDSATFPYVEAIVGFLIISHLFESYLHYRQYRCYFIKEKPNHLADQITDERFNKGQEYGKAKSVFGFVESTYMFIEVLAFFYFGAMPLVWSWSQYIVVEQWGFAPDSEILISLVFLGIYQLYDYTHLPFSLYSVFVIEERFGFNKQTLKLFFVDLLKSLGLKIVIGVPIFSAIISVIQWGGDYFWFYLWVFLLVFQFLMMTIYPIWIAPLFNDFKPLEVGELRTKIEELASQLQFPLTELYVVDGSTRSSHSNAYFYGFFKNKRIVLYDTLLKQVDTTGIVAILGHEMGHWKMNHTIKNLIIMQCYIFVYFYTYACMIHNTAMFRSFGFESQPILIGLILYSLVSEPLGHFFGLAMNFLSRHFEYEADKFATDLGLDLTDPLIRIHVENLSSFHTDPWYSAYHHSHPTLPERLRAIDALKKKNK